MRKRIPIFELPQNERGHDDPHARTYRLRNRAEHRCKGVGTGQVSAFEPRRGKHRRARKASILSDALEAVIGSIFLDGGIECAKRFILSFIKNSVEEAARSLSAKDYKTLLQEYVQHYHSGELEYKVIGMSGPDHKRVFTMCVSIDGVVYGFGDGGTKQEAGQNAARATLELLNRDNV